jgi:Rho guanine nucleotide exchange factor 10
MAAAAAEQADSNDVFGLYGDLLNVRDYDCDSGELSRQGEDLRKSDPELSTIPYRVSTLDRRVKMKTSRPRSLDMSSWSVESKGSAQTTSSSEAGSERPSPSVSRNASFQSTGTTSSVSSLNGAPTQQQQPQPQQQQEQPQQQPPPLQQSAEVSQVVTEEDKKAASKSAKKRKLDAPKTVTTLMGGRGYINWRRASTAAGRSQINNCDAFLVVWEMKL